MRTAKRFFLATAVLAASAMSVADEGQWMPQQVPALADKLRALGFAGDPQAFADLTGQPMGAIVSLGNCTASFVSPEGLLATNHHCVVGSLQYNSTPERNLLEDGFLAKTRGEELWNGPGSKVWVTVSVADVTDAITGTLDPKLDDLRRQELIERRVKERTAACEAQGLRCRVAPFFEGLSYFEIAQLEISDVRLVYAPASGIGDFGGETDNWRWPRHTGDWGFYRAYVGPDGKPAPHSKDNVPFKPRHWLKLQPAGVKEGDLVFVAGYPGRTQRLATYGEVNEAVEWTFPRTIRTYQEQIDLLDALGKQDPALKIKAASRVAGLNNTLTNRKGMLEGLVRGGLLAEKQAREQRLAAWIAADPARQKELGDVLPALAAIEAEASKTRERDAVLAQLYGASTMLGSARTARLVALERAKKLDVDRELGYQERDFPRIREALERAQRSLDPRLDKALLGYWMRHAAGLAAGERIRELDKLAGLTPGMAKADSDAAIDAYLDRLIAGTKLADEGVRMGLLDKTPAEIAATHDSFVDLALALEPLDQQLREAEKRRAGAASRVRPRYAKALLAAAGGLVAPDANLTLRVTYGQVKPRANASDGVDWRAFTTLAGIEKKHTGEGEFKAPDAELAAIKALRAGKASRYVAPELADVPVNFLTTLDITGGNSGSPTLDGRGELVGLVFDGTFDTVASDFVYDTVRTRSIHADVRYLLWTMTEVDGAGHLVLEMGIR
jgi:Peptidase S46